MQTVSLQQFDGTDASLEQLIKNLASLENDLEKGQTETPNEKDWRCSKIAEYDELYKYWSRTFIFHADFAERIREYLELTNDDKKALFDANYPSFSWITNIYKCYYSHSEEKGIPLGNGTYLPVREDEYGLRTLYAQITRRFISEVLQELVQLKLCDGEYLLLKLFLLFEPIKVSKVGEEICVDVRNTVRKALEKLFQNRGADNVGAMSRIVAIEKSLRDIGEFEIASINRFNRSL